MSPAFTAKGAAAATREDRRLVASTHRLGYLILRTIGGLGPVVRVPGIGLVVSEAALLRSILLDPEHFSKVGHGASSSLWTPVIGENALINMDGPEHGALRRQLTPMFTPRFLSGLLGDIIDPQLAELKRRLLAGERVDLAHEVEVTSAMVLCRLAGFQLSGLPEAALLQELGKARELLSLVKLSTRTLNQKQLTTAHAKLANLQDQVRTAYREAQPGTVPTLLREAGLNVEDTVSVVSALILAGTETTISHVPRLAQLLITSGYLGQIASQATTADADRLIDAALQEGLRTTVPSPVMLRSVLKETKVSNHRLKPGDRVVLATSLACARAGDFNPSRPVPVDMRQIWFGAGAHFCIGMPLAMRVTEAYLRLLVEVEASRSLRVTSVERRTRTLAAGYQKFEVIAE
jgi:cytochrome P450